MRLIKNKLKKIKKVIIYQGERGHSYLKGKSVCIFTV